MNASYLPLTIPLHRPWWRRLADLLWSDRCIAGVEPGARGVAADKASGCRFTERDFRALRGLSDGTLRDIGAPGWVAEQRDAARRLDLDMLRL